MAQGILHSTGERSAGAHAVTPRTGIDRAGRTRIVVALFAVLAVVLGVLAMGSPAIAAPSTETVIQKILADTNAVRAEYGLPPLVRNTAIDGVAGAWSGQQASANNMSHNPSYSAQIPAGWSRAAENVAYGYDYTQVTAAWKASSGHLTNMIGDYTHIGIGVAYASNGTPYYTQNFAKYGAGVGATPPPPTPPAPPAPVDRAPVGSFDVAALGSTVGTAQLGGWALDPDTSASIAVHVYVDGAYSTAITANGDRPDIGRAFPSNGSAHGFSATISLTAGYHSICLYAINSGATATNPSLGCRAVTMPSGNPFGSLDVVRLGDTLGTIVAGGWSLDPDTASSTDVHLYVDGRYATAVNASGSRPDIAGAYPGYGPAHGYAASLPIQGGGHTVCAYAINIGRGTINSQLGCRAINVPTGAPFGSFDFAAARPGAITVGGWSLDPDSASSVTMHYYLDGVYVGGKPASDARPDIGGMFPGYGNAHGFSNTLAAAGGWHTICVYAINIGTGSVNPIFGCRAVYVPTGAPYGTFDFATGGSKSITVGGWAVDPDTADSVTMHVYLDGKYVAPLTASDNRPDIAAIFPGYGAAHGYRSVVTATAGMHTVCLYAIDKVTNVGNPFFGCRAVSVTN